MSRTSFFASMGPLQAPAALRMAAAGSVAAPVFTIVMVTSLPSARSDFSKGLNAPRFTRARTVLIGSHKHFYHRPVRTQSTKRMSQPAMPICLGLDSGESYGDIRQFAALL